MARVIAKLGDDVSTDVIYPGRYMATVLPTETPQFAFADNAELNGKLKSKQVPAGSVIVAGKNFGCGSSREQACSCLKGYELTIVAKGFARIFLQNSINLGLNLVTSPDLEAGEGDDLDVTPDKVVDKTTGRSFAVVPLPKARQVIVDAGGLIAYTRKRVLEAAGRAFTS
ncbi:MAG TPA: 3-isopropylmalate dehydratase small subunit [Vicinamibacteria bacterium]|nr:3-isopropylmalate dehydratase small subunit [Vicinamibacteria bacterium]